MIKFFYRDRLNITVTPGIASYNNNNPVVCKKNALLFLLLLSSLISTGQFQYTSAKAQNVAGTYTDLGTSGTVITTANNDNANSIFQNIGFTFYFNGKAFTQFVLNTNGFIKLGTIAPATNNFDMLSSADSNILAPFNYDLRGGTSTTEYRVATSGATGSRVCTIQFENVRDAAASQYNNINFQVKLYETSNMIEFVYGTFTTSGAAAAFKEMIVGIKGSDSTFSVNATKSSADAWSTTTFINGVYPAPNTKFNNRNNVLPPSGRTFRFTPVKDASVEVYTLGELPIPYVNSHIARARVTNTGGTVLANLAVTVNITGDNLFNNSKLVTLIPGETQVISFDPFIPNIAGTNTVTASIPTDDVIFDNSSVYTQIVNSNTFSYASGAVPSGNLGFGNGEGIMLTKYTVTGSALVTNVNVHINTGANTGNTVYAVVMDASGTIVGQSSNYVITAGDLNAYKSFTIVTPPVVTNADFYVGIAQTANAITAYYPLSTQTEGLTTRPGAYYYTGLAGGIPTEFTIGGRYMIQAVVNTFTDAKVEAVYTLAKIPKPFGSYHHVVRAKIKNNSANNLVNYHVTLNITGANTLTVLDSVSLAPQDSVVKEFDRISFWNAGNNTVTVSLPPDNVNSNNSASFLQVVNDTLFSYADTAAIAGSAGFGTGVGTLSVYYESPGGSVQVTDVRVRISNNAANVGKTVQAVARTTGFAADTVYSNPYVIQNADLGTFKKFKLNTPLNDEANVYFAEEARFYVGLKQFAGAGSYFPVSYQKEGPPARPGIFYKDSANSSYEFDDGRLMIEAIVKTAPAIPEYPQVILSDWDFTGINSPASAAATTHYSLLTSSNLLTRGPGAAASPGSNSFLTTGFKNNGIATSNTDYFEFKVATGASDTMSLSYIDFSEDGDADFNAYPTGVNSQFAYSLDGVNFTLIHSPINTYSGDASYVTLSDIPALQNLANTTVTIRYYASGSNSTGAWGLTGLTVSGSVRNYTIIPDPVAPTGADYFLPACNSTLPGSISFTSVGAFPPGNVYIAKMDNSIWIDNPAPVVIGTLASNANSGTINFTIPANSFDGYHKIWIESSAVPGATSLLSQTFFINRGVYCPNAGDRFRSKQSGNWNDTATWETQAFNTPWIPSPIIPDTAAYLVTISANDTVTITTPIIQHWLHVNGTLKLLNGGVNHGSLMLCWSHENNHLADAKPPMTVYNTFQVISSAIYDSVIKISPTYPGIPRELIRVSGRIVIGDGSAINGDGFYAFGTRKVTRFYSGGVFEWNSTSANGPIGNATYFENSGHPILRFTKMPAGGVGSLDSMVVNGFVEVNTPVTMSGTGKKIFVDGIKGSSTLTQAAGSGEFKTLSEYEIIPPSSDDPGSTVGIMDGTVTLNLSNAGLTLANGITVTDSANVRIIGSGISKGKINVQAGGKMTLDPASVMTIENADLANYGTINGTGTIQFTGAETSVLESPGIINSKIELLNKQLRLDTNATTSSIDLLGGSRLRLDRFNLNMRTGSLVGDASNFIVTNDTGRLSRYVAGPANDVPFHIGVSDASYSPVTITNSGTPDNFSVRVGIGVYKDSVITSGFVNRTWFIMDSLEGGGSVKLKMQWRSVDEQATGFDRSRSYISHVSVCPLPRNCSGSYFDRDSPNNATSLGSGNYSLQRLNIDSFKTNSFVVTSRPFVYTFTGGISNNWSDSLNWTPAIPPPHIISDGMEVIIEHSTALPEYECVSNGDIQVIGTGKLTVKPGRKLRVIH